MRLTQPITVYSRQVSGNKSFWLRFETKKALVKITESANSNISAKGFVPNSNIIVRFPKSQVFSLKPGDKIYPGISESDIPPLNAYSVLSVTGGNIGSRTLKLVKAVCG